MVTKKRKEFRITNVSDGVLKKWGNIKNHFNTKTNTTTLLKLVEWAHTKLFE